MRLRNVPGAREEIAASKYVLLDDAKTKGKWNEIFDNDHPIQIEIGMGKGTFIMEMAQRHPEINFVGIEKYSSVLVRALEKLEAINNEKEEKGEATINNLLLFRMDAENIENYFAKDEVSDIFLNFSDPWPKDRHAKRRLTSDRFLAKYINLMKKTGTITFKTDNTDLFNFSVETANEEGWTFLKKTDDLHHSEYNEGNIMTEYEKKFSEMGNKIHMMQIIQ
ncbi:MAG: tRNA (guanosine(46)-N7)-methyltransferase TrmB [Lachnospiraceae bacterium]|nr:tRNA (guanosine(46)-N7)-methyltransferase TrmB [Lachnospiraceae bacterium]